MLSKEQIEQFNRDGFLLVRGMYNAAEMEEISRWTDEVAGSPEVPGHYMMYFESSKQDGSRIISRIEDFVSFHDGFAALITRQPETASLAKRAAAVILDSHIRTRSPVQPACA